jgi:hypothetical protein
LFIFEHQSDNMNVKRLYQSIGLVVVLFIFSCGGKHTAHDHDQHASGDASEWKEMDDFHMVMAETFHPYKDSTNLEPAKARAAELLVAADQWVAAPLPAKVDNDEVRAKLQQLKAEAATLAESVRSSDDNVIAEDLTRLHETFHSIQEAWYEQ